MAVDGNFIYISSNVTGLYVLWAAEQASGMISSSSGSLTSPNDGILYTFPDNAFNQPVKVTHTPLFQGNLPGNGALVPAGYAYQVDATAGGTPIQPALPYTVTVPYDPYTPTIIESTLALYYLDGATWVKEPTSVVDTNAKTITAHPNHLSTWAVFGEALHLYFPVINH